MPHNDSENEKLATAEQMGLQINQEAATEHVEKFEQFISANDSQGWNNYKAAQEAAGNRIVLSAAEINKSKNEDKPNDVIELDGTWNLDNVYASGIEMHNVSFENLNARNADFASIAGSADGTVNITRYDTVFSGVTIENGNISYANLENVELTGPGSASKNKGLTLGSGPGSNVDAKYTNFQGIDGIQRLDIADNSDVDLEGAYIGAKDTIYREVEIEPHSNDFTHSKSSAFTFSNHTAEEPETKKVKIPMTGIDDPNFTDAQKKTFIMKQENYLNKVPDDVLSEFAADNGKGDNPGEQNIDVATMTDEQVDNFVNIKKQLTDKNKDDISKAMETMKGLGVEATAKEEHGKDNAFSISVTNLDSMPGKSDPNACKNAHWSR